MSTAAPPARRPDAKPKPAAAGSVLVLAVPGPRFAGGRADRFADAARGAGGPAPLMVLDLSAVTAVDAAGLRAVAAVARGCRDRGGEVAVAGAVPAVWALLAAAGLYELADVYPTPEQAAAALQRG